VSRNYRSPNTYQTKPIPRHSILATETVSQFFRYPAIFSFLPIFAGG
jgi:hypothetical protein